MELENVPEDLIQIIWELLEPEIKVWINKKYYKKYHSVIQLMIPRFDSFTRSMVRHDNNFIMEQLIPENLWRWINIKKYPYEGRIYPNYMMFFLNFCIDNDAVKCKNILYRELEKYGLRKNLHKKNRIRNIRWRT